ncbi:MAG: MFS transporter [Clostridiaceae bacterium]|jgi:predicted MFS family arabinose efflux permease|nr:MFS transporter [Clostridiaceae bacterium]
MKYNYKSNIWKLYAIRFFHNLIPAYVIERLFWEQRGMTIRMVVYTEIIYAITIVLLEIPTGIIADKWGRKRMMVLNAFLGCCEFFILIFATEFWHFAAVVFLAGIGHSACSGSENALLYDSLVHNNETHLFEKYLGSLNAFDFSAAMLAALSGSIMTRWFKFEFNYWISFASMLISLCISLVLIETDIKSENDESVEIRRYVSDSVLFFKKNPGVCLVVLSGMIAGSAVNFIDEFWQIYANRIGFPVVFFGLLSAGFMIFRLPGNMFAYALKKRFSYRALISGVIAVYTAGFACLWIIKGYSSFGYYGLAAIFLIYIVSGILEPIVTGYLHHRIDSTMRATIDSFQSLGLRAVAVIAGLGFGFISSKFDIFGGYGFIALICGTSLICFLTLSKVIVEE